MPIARRYMLGLVVAAALGPLRGFGSVLLGQAPAPATTPATAGTRQIGTVKEITGSNMTMTTDAGHQVAVAVTDAARIVQLAPGSTDLKAAQVITLGDIGTGDRVLVTGKAGDAPGSFLASRIILMKSGDIAQKHAAEQADWQKRGIGGIVGTVDATTGSITVSSGARKTQVQTQSATIFRRYAGDSVKFEDAKPGTLAQVHAGDQIEVRGAKSEDGATLTAEEVVSGSFRNLSGTVITADTAAGKLTLKDLATKKTVTVTVTANSDLRKLSAELAARFAARQRGGSANASVVTGSGSTGARPGADQSQGPGRRPPPSSGDANASGTSASALSGTGGTDGGQGRSAGMDLSKMLARLPNTTLADLHAGDAVMIVASQSQPGSDVVTAVTLLAGVEPILAATSSGSQAMTLSPWSVGGGAPEGGGGGAP